MLSLTREIDALVGYGHGRQAGRGRTMAGVGSSCCAKSGSQSSPLLRLDRYFRHPLALNDDVAWSYSGGQMKKTLDGSVVVQRWPRCTSQGESRW
jgi:hypothetical protein